MDEFALCWNNFADNIASGFQSLFDRGDLVDVTIACDGKLLKAHKIVLAICSPYFFQMFQENPCKHPIIVLKDVAVNVMQELLQFMYQGEVNVKHSELQSFMKIAETLQIKGLTASHRNDRNSSAAASPAAHLHQPQPAHSNSNSNNNNNGRPSTSQLDPSKLNSYLAAAAKESLKRAAEFPPSTDPFPIHYPKKPLKRSTDSIDQESNSDCMDQLSSDEVFIPTSPQVSMIEPQAPSAASSTPSRQFDLSSVKREHTNDSSCSPQHLHQSPTNLATSAAAMGASAAASMKLGFSSTPTHHHGHGGHSGLHPMFGAFDPSGASFSGIASSLASISGAGVTAAAAGSGAGGKADYSSADYSQDYGKGGVPPGHMDIPAGPSITMLSSTSLLHHNCIFNRNNTVATQQGLKTYWLCKSYRVSMCRARCITHHGQVISSTGVHNHPPHMKGPHEFSQQPPAVPPAPPPPPPPPMTSGNHHGVQNHPHLEHQNHMNHHPPPPPPQMVTSNGTYDHHDRMPPPPPHLQHYQPGPMGPVPHEQYPQHHYQDPYQPYPQAPSMIPPPPPPQHHQMTQNGGPAMPPEVPDVKLIQLQPVPPMDADDSLGRSVASAIGAESATDSILLPPPPQPPSAAPAPDLQLKTEQIS